MAGAPFDARVTVEVPEETACDAVEVRLRGFEAHRFYRQFKHSCVERDVLIDATRTFSTELLTKGTHHYDVRFELPGTLPASFRNDHSEVRYGIEVIAKIPFWLDGHFEEAIRVVRPEPPFPPPRLRRWASRESPVDVVPLIELSLPSDAFALGERLHGALAISCIRHRLARIDVGIEATETVGNEFIVSLEEVRWAVSDESPASGETLRFTVEIPTRLGPTQLGKRFRIEHALFVQLVEDSVARPPIELRVPIELYESLRPAPPPRAKLAVLGRRRSVIGWKKAVEKFLEQDKVELLAVDGNRKLGFRVGEVRVQASEVRAEKGRMLHAELSWPRLGVGLWALWSGATAPAWFLPTTFRDSEGRTESPAERSARAAKAIKLPIQTHDAGFAKRLEALDVGLAMRWFESGRLGDDGGLLDTPGWGHSVEGVSTFLKGAFELATLLSESFGAITPPPSVSHARAAYEIFAARKGARLTIGNLSVSELECNGCLCELRHGFVGKPKTRLIVSIATAAGRPVTFRPSDIEALASLGATSDSSGDAVTVSFGSFVEDPKAVEHVIESVSRVVRDAGSAEASPYR